LENSTLSINEPKLSSHERILQLMNLDLKQMTQLQLLRKSDSWNKKSTEERTNRD